MKKRKIAFITGTRADFGLMTSVLNSIKNSQKLDLQIFATGMHLMPKFGLTFNEVQKSFPQVEKIDVVFKEDNKSGMAEFIADFAPEFLKKLKVNNPDMVLVLGDRVEMLAVSLVSAYLGIPIAHIHGGDKTMTVDESARHAITKFAHLHFAATKDSAKRISKLGEEKWRIYIVGAPSLDNILIKEIPGKKQVYSFLDLELDKKFILVLQHSVTGLENQAEEQIKKTLNAVKSFNLPVVVIYPNSDPGSLKIIKVLETEKNNPNFRLFPNVEYKMFLGMEKEASVWVGNSSGGIIESASFRTPVVNVGDRQMGRPQSGNILNVDYDQTAITRAIKKSLFDKEYLKKIKGVKNIWGDGKASSKIVKILEEIEIGPKLLTKQITY